MDSKRGIIGIDCQQVYYDYNIRAQVGKTRPIGYRIPHELRYERVSRFTCKMLPSNRRPGVYVSP